MLDTPPSIGIVAPVINDDSSEARNKASLATSSGRPHRRSGVLAISALLSAVFAMIGVLSLVSI